MILHQLISYLEFLMKSDLMISNEINKDVEDSMTEDYILGLIVSGLNIRHF